MLSAHTDFAGTVVLVFQPAEEGAAGASAMLADGLLDRFGIQEIYALHNIPGLPTANIAVRPGTMLASFDHLEIVITAQGGHPMAPHLAGDVITAGAYLVTALQTIVARRLDPLVPATLSITEFTAGSTNNVVPTRAVLRGTARCLDAATSAQIEGLVRQACTSVADAHGVSIELDHERRYPCTVNDPECADRVARVAADVVGDTRVDPHCAGILAAEDFSFYLERIPGAYAFIGNGPITAESGPVHSPTYEFNDEIIEYGARYLAGIARTAIAERTRVGLSAR